VTFTVITAVLLARSIVLLLGERLPTFRKTVVSPSSQVKQSKNKAPLPVCTNCLTLEMKADRPFEMSGPLTQRQSVAVFKPFAVQSATVHNYHMQVIRISPSLDHAQPYNRLASGFAVVAGADQ